MHHINHILTCHFLLCLMLSMVLLGLLIAAIQWVGMFKKRNRNESPSVFVAVIALLLMVELFISYPEGLTKAGIDILRLPLLLGAGPSYYFSMVQVSYDHASPRRILHYWPALIVFICLAFATFRERIASDLLLCLGVIHCGIYMVMIYLLVFKYKLDRDFFFQPFGFVTWICWYRILPLLMSGYLCSLLCKVLWKAVPGWSFLNCILLTFILLDVWMVILDHVDIKH